MEEWRDIPGYEGLYKVSSFGKVWSARAKREMSLIRDRNGYLRVSLIDRGGNRKTMAAHRLVAKCFIPNPGNLPCVNHMDENKENNSVESLEWCDYRYNNTFGTAIYRRQRKMLPDGAIGVRCIETGVVYKTQMEARKSCGVGASALSDCLRRRHKTCGGFHWEYAMEGA